MPFARARSTVRRQTVSAVRWVARNRHRLPGPVRSGLEWLRWRMPTGVMWRLTGRRGKPVSLQSLQPRMPMPPVPTTARRLLVGPANYAGQGTLWARAVGAHAPDADGRSFALEVPHGFAFPVDYEVSAVTYRRNTAWQREFFEYVAEGYTHVLLEACKPLFGDLHRVSPFREAEALAERGLVSGMMAHGTDVRLPSRHAAAHPWSPYRDRDWDVVDQIEARAAQNLFNLGRFDGPVFVSTPDLLDDLPQAVWCPVVVDPARWANDLPVLEREVPVVVHVPSVSRVKGTEQVETALRTLEGEGLIEYRRIEGVPSSQMPDLYGSADVVLDQFRLGSYGVAACEAMAAGKVVIGNVTDEVRDRVRTSAGAELPIVQAVPDTIEEVVRQVLADRDTARATAESGPVFTRTVHDGRLSAARLGTLLDKRSA